MKRNRLKKVLGVAFGIAVVVGSTIGVGILRTPGSIASLLPRPGLILLCWTLAGLYAVLGASSYAELATMIPKAGGAYNYIKRAFGGYAGFLSGWFDYLCNALAPAFMCIVIGEYCALLFPSLVDHTRIVALAFLTLFTAINLPGVKNGSVTQQITSAIKILLFLVLVVACFLHGPTQPRSSPLPSLAIEGGLLFGMIKALQLIIGSYDGWVSVSFFAEEDRDPGKNIPKSYLIGTLSIMAMYVLINAAILYVLPVSSVAQSALAARDAASVTFGKWSADFIIIVALFSLISIVNAYIMIPSRILFGMSREGYFFGAGTRVNRGGTPYVSTLISYAFAFVMIFSDSFEKLFRLSTFMSSLVLGLAFVSLLGLRIKEPDLPRPYKAWMYPYSTLLAIAVTLALLVAFAIGDRLSFLIVLGITGLSYVLYRIFIRPQPAEAID